jgi:hypothetical protein
MRKSHVYFIYLTLLVAHSLASLPAMATGTASARAVSLRAIEKISVFPLLYRGESGDRTDDATAKGLDEAWWQAREELTQTGRFLVASRVFLQKNDAFQPRGRLTAADAVILGRYVEADALMTMTLERRVFTLSVWDTQEGALAWVQSVELHPSILVREQIAQVARGLVKEFIASMPYHGVVLQDPLAKRPVFEEGGAKLLRLKVGSYTGYAQGDVVQVVQLSRLNMEPLFQGGIRTAAVAEAKILRLKDQTLTVELTKVAPEISFQAGALVVIPSESERLKAWAKPRDSMNQSAIVSVLATSAAGEHGLSEEAAVQPEALQAERRKDESGALATTLSILASLAVILLLAF